MFIQYRSVGAIALFSAPVLVMFIYTLYIFSSVQSELSTLRALLNVALVENMRLLDRDSTLISRLSSIEGEVGRLQIAITDLEDLLEPIESIERLGVEGRSLRFIASTPVQ